MWASFLVVACLLSLARALHRRFPCRVQRGEMFFSYLADEDHHHRTTEQLWIS